MVKPTRKTRRGTTSRAESSSSVSSTNTHLPIDLITDILSRLPVKSLLRFKSVSKTWYHLIQTPTFINLHKKVSGHSVFTAILATGSLTSRDKWFFSLNLIDALDKPIHIEFPFMSDCNRGCQVMGICNGLVCLMLLDKSSDIIVCNPATGKFKKIPSFDGSSWYQDHIFYGFSSGEDGYEIVRIDYESIRVKVSFYSLCTGIWEDVKVKMGKCETYSDSTAFMEPLRCNELVPVFKSGVFYWKGHDSDEYGRIMIFDVSNEVFDEIWAPEDTCGCSKWELKELNEQVVVVIYYLGVEFDLWVLNENDKTWELFEEIDLRDSITVFPKDGQLAVFGCAGDDVLVLGSRDWKNPKFYLYDIDTGDANILPYVNGADEFYLYAESLASVETSDDVAN